MCLVFTLYLVYLETHSNHSRIISALGSLRHLRRTPCYNLNSGRGAHASAHAIAPGASCIWSEGRRLTRPCRLDFVRGAGLACGAFSWCRVRVFGQIPRMRIGGDGGRGARVWLRAPCARMSAADAGKSRPQAPHTAHVGFANGHAHGRWRGPRLPP